jgi:hypothetical protein
MNGKCHKDTEGFPEAMVVLIMMALPLVNLLDTGIDFCYYTVAEKTCAI